jgi:hypothetical protein
MMTELTMAELNVTELTAAELIVDEMAAACSALTTPTSFCAASDSGRACGYHCNSDEYNESFALHCSPPRNCNYFNRV